MNMAMNARPQLPTPYPVGVNGMSGWTDWLGLVSPLTIPFTTLVSDATSSPNAINPNAMSVYNAKHPQTPISKGGLTAAQMVKYGVKDFATGAHDPVHDTAGFFGGNEAASWLVVNWPWIALLGGGAIVLKYLSKRN